VCASIAPISDLTGWPRPPDLPFAGRLSSAEPFFVDAGRRNSPGMQAGHLHVPCRRRGTRR
jgi:hypothetical protein